ncbi:MAG: RHS repeat-associated core domain-containing protein, partial [Candidatus Rokuibacteriota bacterium]
PAVDTDETGHGHAHVTNADGHPAVDQTAPVELDEKEWTGERRAGKPHSRWRELAPLQAPPGVTALAGQVLRLNGRPLADVTLRIGARSARTDDTGRFLLRDVPAGYPTLIMDGSTASRRGRTYATFDKGVHVEAGNTNVLPYTIWLPLIDTQHATRVLVPTPQEIVATTPRVPGLEMRIPAGVVLRMRDGQPLRWVTLTQVPVDRPPFPLPEGTTFFFTPQTHGAQVERADGTASPRGVRFILPNVEQRAPGVRVDLWSYDTRRHWYVYGQGTVRRDGRQIMPDPGVEFHRVTCFFTYIGLPGTAPPSGPTPAGASGGDPVDLATGMFVLTKTDLMVPDVIPIVIRRAYRPDGVRRPFGWGGDLPYQWYLVGDHINFTYADLVREDGSKLRYTRISPGTGYADAVMEHTTTPTVFHKSRLTWNAARAGWDVTRRDGTVYEFLGYANWPGSRLIGIRDRWGNRLTVTRNYATVYTTHQVLRITTPNGRWVEFSYHPTITDLVTQVRDHAGRTVSYTYDAQGNLLTVTDPAGGVTEYTYDQPTMWGRMITLKDARGIVFLTNEYDAAGRVVRQTQADGTTYEFAYTLNPDGKIIQTDVTNPRGFVRRVTFNVAGYLLTDTHAHGTLLGQTTTYERNAANQPTAIIDALNRRTEFTYDAMGNVLTATRLVGTPNAVTTTYTYETMFNQVATVTDPLGHTTTLGYDGLGNLTTITNPLGHQVTRTHNAAGQPLTVATPAGTITFGYERGDLVTISDPTGQTTTRFTDAAGRLVALTNPLGQRTRYEYDALNRLTKITDALGGLTQFGYDPNGNLLSVTDARSNATTYAYNSMDQLQTRTAPLLRVESYTYDNNGNVATFTDRKSQVTSRTYDALDRLTLVTYADGSTTAYTWDAGNRLTQITDSLSGTITRTYDLLDRLTQETTPQGTVTYTHDAAGRRTSMTVAGQPAVSYTYDNANRLTTITQGANAASYTYDNAGRRTSLTLPNGGVTEYAYDAASRLTGLTYKNGPVALGTLTYGYDSNGHRRQIGGSWGRTGLPQPLASATYDAANRVLMFGGAAPTHDFNGNLTNDGVTTYIWDARNRLSGLSGPGVTATFQYDAVGRRVGKTLNGTTTTVLHNGLDAVQETTGATVRNILTGTGIDEYLSHASTSGETRFALADALGSTIALADASGSVVTEYTYEPFGTIGITGAPSENRAQYTGRENDGTGLYHYRARYYHPSLHRFISEDPIGSPASFACAVTRDAVARMAEATSMGSLDLRNLYAYVRNNPTAFRDPTGLIPESCWNNLFCNITVALACELVCLPFIEVPPMYVACAGACFLASSQWCNLQYPCPPPSKSAR